MQVRERVGPEKDPLPMKRLPFRRLLESARRYSDGRTGEICQMSVWI